MREIKVTQIPISAFELIGDDWMLISAKDEQGRTNAMTASWGGLGVLWGKQVAYIFIRPQRYTKQVLDCGHSLSLSFFDNSQKKMLSYMGSVSGRDEDKIKTAALDYTIQDDAIVFDKAKYTFICEKLYCQEMKEECFIDKGIISKWFKQKDFHYMYIVEIKKVLVQ